MRFQLLHIWKGWEGVFEIVVRWVPLGPEPYKRDRKVEKARLSFFIIFKNFIFSFFTLILAHQHGSTARSNDT